MHRLNAAYESEKAKLLAEAEAAAPRVSINLGTLPAPVRRYVELSRMAGVSRPRGAVVTQRGELRAAPGKSWMSFTAEQVYCMDPPGFVWLARARVAPMIGMTAMDSFLGGRGNMRIRLWDLMNLANAKGPELDQGAALRYWGEVLAFPSVAASSYISWDGLDSSQARFTTRGFGPDVSGVVEFDSEGRPAATHAQRYRDVGGKSVLTPWSGLMREWKRIDGRLFPSVWESVWHLGKEGFLAVRMEILEVRTI